MSISGQEPIRIGQPNDPANSDSLFKAFNSIQNNFTTVFNTASNISTISAGNGVQVTTTGNSVVVTNAGVTKLVAGDNVTITTLGGSPGSNGALVISSTGTGGNGGGSVTSVGVVSNTLVVADTPVIGAGNISVNLPILSNVAGTYRNPNVTVDQTGRVVGIANGAVSGTVTSVAVQSGNGLSVSGSPITSNGTITINNTGVTSIVAGSGIAINQSNGAVTITNTGGGGAGGGTVTRVGVLSNTLSVSGSPIITSGNINIELPANVSINNIDSNSANISTLISNGSITVSKTNTLPGITLDTYSTNANISRFVGRKARGTSTSPQSIVSGDLLTGIQSKGYSSFNTFQDGAGIQFQSTGLPANSSSYIPSQVSIYAADSANTLHSVTLTSTGNISFPGSLVSTLYSDLSQVTTYTQARARGNRNSISPLQIGDTVFRENSFGYTGNGTSNIAGVTGYSLSTSSYSIVVGLPSSPGQYIPTDYYISTTSNANTTLNAVFSHTGNFTIPGSFNGQNIDLSGNVETDSVIANILFGTLGTSSQPNITSIGTLSSLAVTGNVSTGNVSGSIGSFASVTGSGAGLTSLNASNISSGILDQARLANSTLTVNGTVLTLGGSGTVTASAQTLTGTTLNSTITDSNLTSLGTLSSLNVSGNITANRVTANLFTGVLTTSAQPNITSVGNLISLNVTGNITANGIQLTNSVTLDTTSVIVATVPIIINGVTYKLMLTQ